MILVYQIPPTTNTTQTFHCLLAPYDQIGACEDIFSRYSISGIKI